MKKILALLTAGLFICGLTACGEEKPVANPASTTEQTVQKPAEMKNSATEAPAAEAPAAETPAAAE